MPPYKIYVCCGFDWVCFGVPVSKLYIADDNADFAGYLATVAERQGWSVEICANGNELVNGLMSETCPAVALVDIHMPELDGIEVIELLVDIDRPLRFRFMTGGADAPMLAAKLMARARNLAVGRNLYKPVEMETLKRVLDEERNALLALAS